MNAYARSNSSNHLALGPVDEQMEDEQLDSTIPKEDGMDKQLFLFTNIEREGKDSTKLGDKVTVRPIESMKNQVDELMGKAHSSNIPTLQFSSPHLEQIIKDAQIAMMMNANMVK